MALQKAALASSLALAVMCAVVAPAAQAFTPTNEMVDLSPEHWAYRAIQELMEKYQILEGYPDKTFRGQRTLTRYEFAAALYRVMTRVEELVAASGNKGGPPIDIDRTDIETIAALQKEFRDELNSYRGRLNMLEERIKLLDAVKIGGSVEVRYRDRVAVTDSTLSSSPLFNSNPDAQQINSPARNFVSRRDRFPFRVRTRLNLDASIMPQVKYAGTFFADEGAFLGTNSGQQAVFIGGHFGEEGFLGAPFYVARSFVDTSIPLGEGLGAPNMSIKFGVYNFNESINPGTRLQNHFSGESWVGHGYGMVGWGGDEIPTVNQGQQSGSNPYTNSVSRFWVGDINASRVDPNSKRYNQASSPSVSVDLNWGAFSMFFGANNGSFYTSRLLASQGNLSNMGAVTRGIGFGSLINADAVVGNMDRLSRIRSNVLDLPADLNDGYGVLGVELDLGRPIGNDAVPVRLGIHGMDYWNDAAFALSGTRKEISAVIDVGTNALGATAQVNSSFIGYDMASVGVFANNIAGSGVDAGVGGKMAMRSLTTITGPGIAAANAGGYLSLPDFGGSIPKVMFALRQSFGDTLGSEAGYQFLKDSGITISAPFKNIANTNLDLTLEYNALMEGGFFSGRFLAHDVAVYTRYSF
ncbi:MAG: iron uptake porin [Candidatus Sericytochromatia bacterium]